MHGDHFVHLVMPFPRDQPNVDVSMSVAAFVKMVDAMNQDGVYPDHLFPDPLDIADDPGDISYRGKNWEVDCPVGSTLETIKSAILALATPPRDIPHIRRQVTYFPFFSLLTLPSGIYWKCVGNVFGTHSLCVLQGIISLVDAGRTKIPLPMTCSPKTLSAYTCHAPGLNVRGCPWTPSSPLCTTLKMTIFRVPMLRGPSSFGNTSGVLILPLNITSKISS